MHEERYGALPADSMPCASPDQLQLVEPRSLEMSALAHCLAETRQHRRIYKRADISPGLVSSPTASFQSGKDTAEGCPREKGREREEKVMVGF